AINDRDIVRRDACFSADLFVALQQTIIELSVSCDLTLEDIVSDSEFLLGERRALELSDRPGELRFLVLRGQILITNAVADAASERRDLAIEFADGRRRLL